MTPWKEPDWKLNWFYEGLAGSPYAAAGTSGPKLGQFKDSALSAAHDRNLGHGSLLLNQIHPQCIAGSEIWNFIGIGRLGGSLCTSRQLQRQSGRKPKLLSPVKVRLPREDIDSYRRRRSAATGSKTPERVEGRSKLRKVFSTRASSCVSVPPCRVLCSALSSRTIWRHRYFQSSLGTNPNAFIT